jgi:WD40 repeat protein
MKTLHIPQQNSFVTALAWSPVGHLIAGVCEDGTVVVWNVVSGQVVFCRRVARTRLLTVTWSENGRCLAIGAENHTLTILQVRDGAILLSQVFDAPVQKIAFAPRGGRFVVVAGRMVYIYYGGHKEPVTLEQPSPVLDVSWSPTGGRFAVVCHLGDVVVYNALRRRHVYTLNDVCEPRSVAWNMNGRDVVIGTANGCIHIHDGSTGCQYTSYPLSLHPIERLAWGDPCLAVIDAHAEVTLWDLLPREPSFILVQRYPTPLQTFALSPNGAQIATGMQQGVCVAPAG